MTTCVGVSFNPDPLTHCYLRVHLPTADNWKGQRGFISYRQDRSITATSRNDRLSGIRVGLLSPVNGTKVELEEEPCFTVIAFWLHNKREPLPGRQTEDLFVTAEQI